MTTPGYVYAGQARRAKRAVIAALEAEPLRRCDLIKKHLTGENNLDRVLRALKSADPPLARVEDGIYYLTEAGFAVAQGTSVDIPSPTVHQADLSRQSGGGCGVAQPMPRRGQLTAVERERDAEARELEPDAPRIRYVLPCPSPMVLRVEQWDRANDRLSDQPPELLPVLALALRTDGRCVAMVPGRRGAVVPCDDPVDGPLAVDGTFGTVELAVST